MLFQVIYVCNVTFPDVLFFYLFKVKAPRVSSVYIPLLPLVPSVRLQTAADHLRALAPGDVSSVHPGRANFSPLRLD